VELFDRLLPSPPIKPWSASFLGLGEDTDAIHNGLGRDRWLKSFDQRLNGSHQIEGALFIHPGDCGREGSYRQPWLTAIRPVACLNRIPRRASTAKVDILHFEEPGLIATSVFTPGDEKVVAGSIRPGAGSRGLWPSG